MQQSESRVYVFDNLKAILVTLVVFGHILEPLLPDSLPRILYVFIYMFHMPLFIFCLGYFAKYNPRKLLTRLIAPYLTFQVLYILFERVVMGNRHLPIQFTTPNWIMWYLLAATVWISCIPLLDILIATRRGTWLTISISLLIGLVSGFEHTLGYYMSLARIIYFFPFFIIGYCVKKSVTAEQLLQFLSKRTIRWTSGALTACIGLWLVFHYQSVNSLWFFGAFSYGLAGYTLLVRLLCYLAALVISLFVLSVTPRKQLFFSYIGTRTLQVFLLHGFVMRLLIRYNVFLYTQNVFVLFLASVLIVAALSANPLAGLRKVKQKEKLTEGV